VSFTHQDRHRPCAPFEQKALIWTLQKPKLYRAGGDSKPKIRKWATKAMLLLFCGGIVDTIDRVGYGPIMQRIGGMVLPMGYQPSLKRWMIAYLRPWSLYPTGEITHEKSDGEHVDAKPGCYLHVTTTNRPDWYGGCISGLARRNQK